MVSSVLLEMAYAEARMERERAAAERAKDGSPMHEESGSGRDEAAARALAVRLERIRAAEHAKHVVPMPENFAELVEAAAEKAARKKK